MTAHLTRDRLEAARQFMRHEAVSLEHALWSHRFDDGPPDAIVAALTPYQNSDGGFGHGLEGDLSTPASTAIATSVGLRHLRRAGVAADHPMVAGARDWLASVATDGVFPIIGPEVDQAPHAPWWDWSDDLAESWNGFRWNPTAEILAHLYVFRGGAPAGLLEAVEARLRRSIAETQLIAGPYDLRCAVVLAETEAAPADLRRALTRLLVRSVEQHDSASEHAPALDLATSPNGVLASALSDRIEPAAATLVGGQQADGGWTPFWDWSFVDAAAWAAAKASWRGTLTRLAVEALAAHGRVEGL